LANLDAFRRQCQPRRAIREDRIGRGRQSDREAPSRIPFRSRTRASRPISTPRWRGMMPRAGQHHAQLCGRPSIYTLTDAIRKRDFRR
jgi:hypothetical protein